MVEDLEVYVSCLCVSDAQSGWGNDLPPSTTVTVSGWTKYKAVWTNKILTLESRSWWGRQIGRFPFEVTSCCRRRDNRLCLESCQIQLWIEKSRFSCCEYCLPWMTPRRLCVGARLRRSLYRYTFFAVFQGDDNRSDRFWDFGDGKLLGVLLPVSKLSPASCIGLREPSHKGLIIFG